MRWLVLVLLLVPASAGALLEDPSGDVSIVAEGEEVGTVPSGVRDSIDILSVDIEETPTVFRFLVEFAARQSPGEEGLKDWLMQVRFQHGEESYRVVLHELVPGGGIPSLQRLDPADGYYRTIERLESTWEGSTLAIEVPRHLVPTEHGAPPSPATRLETIQATSRAPELTGALLGVFPSFFTGEPYAIVMRDTAGEEEPASYDIQMGMEQTGTGRLSSSEPFRVSNGEASTFVYWVNASRAAGGSGTYTLHATNVPSGWGVEVPAGRIDVAQGTRWRFPVILHTAFAHAHGDSESLVLEMRDVDGAGTARLEIGILYPLVPQPSGHHDTLYLRSRIGQNFGAEATAAAREPVFGNGGHEVAYMNAAEEDDNDLGAPVDFRRCGPTFSTEVHRCLNVPLAPSLQMGLDFRPGETGTLEFELDSPVPLVGARIEGTLVHYRIREVEIVPGFTTMTRAPTVLAHLATTNPFDVDRGTAHPVSFEVDPTPAADLVEYERLAGLELRFNLTYTSVPDPLLVYGVFEVNPRLLPGGVMQLPLDEYKDPVAALPNLGSDLEWWVNTTERRANAGDVIVYQATLHNRGATDTFAIRLVGQNREWAEAPTGDVRLRANATHDVTVVVRVPPGSGPQTTADLVLEAASTSDVTRRSLLQFRTIIVEEPVPDDAQLLDGLQEPGKRSPGIGVAALAAGLLALVWPRRR